MESESNEWKINIKTLNWVLIVAVAILVLFNQYQIYSINKGNPLTLVTGNVVGAGNSGTQTNTVSLSSDVIPTGIPRIYGEELGISYDDISPNDPVLADQTISLLGNYDRTITLTGAELERYIKIASSISCEYCCGAKAIIFSNGEAACGCAHSYAMRGLAKYLIKNHGTEFTDEEILSELGKWKVLFFPEIHQQKAAALEENGIEINYITLASNQYRGIEQGAASGGMVGGC